MTPRHKATSLARTLAPLEPRPLRRDELSRAAGGGETASTSTSGTPAAGDDTIGDRSGTFEMEYVQLTYQHIIR